MKKILIADDNAELRESVAEVLAEAGYYTELAANGKEAAVKAAETDFDVVLLDMLMPVMKGPEALIEIKKTRPSARVIVMTAFSTIEDAVEVIKKGASDYIVKPFKIEHLLTIVRREIEESGFEKDTVNIDLDRVLNCLSNPIRRNIIKFLHRNKEMRFMELNRELKMDDHTKLVFHLKILKEAGISTQDKNKNYMLTHEGVRVFNCLALIRNYLMPQPE
ncbi:response regulator [Candidatus Magnetominusculus dajiuhuensis]|uniref:response regulator n=1 Tax=Candidatus Magnetominusculus dajiuhuensis TaxID=3137712 RepID=UPI003B42EA27